MHRHLDSEGASGHDLSEAASSLLPANAASVAIQRNSASTSMAKYKLEYIWLDGYEPVRNLRSKTARTKRFVDHQHSTCLSYGKQDRIDI